MKSGTVECKFTILIRILKKGIPHNIMNDIRKRIFIRFNEVPFTIDEDYKNKVFKENSELYILNIRD